MSKTNDDLIKEGLLARIRELESINKHKDMALSLTARFITDMDYQERDKPYKNRHEESFLLFAIDECDCDAVLNKHLDSRIIKDAMMYAFIDSNISNPTIERALDELYPSRAERTPTSPVFDRHIHDLELTVHTTNRLLENDIKTIGDLVRCPMRHLKTMPNLGKKSLADIKDNLERVGLEIQMTEKQMIGYG